MFVETLCSCSSDSYCHLKYWMIETFTIITLAPALSSDLWLIQLVWISREGGGERRDYTAVTNLTLVIMRMDGPGIGTPFSLKICQIK